MTHPPKRSIAIGAFPSLGHAPFGPIADKDATVRACFIACMDNIVRFTPSSDSFGFRALHEQAISVTWFTGQVRTRSFEI